MYSPLSCSLPGERGSCELREFGVGVRVTGDSPTAFGLLGQELPGALAKTRIAGGRGNDLRQFVDDAELLLAVENSDWGEHLHSDVVAVSGDVGDRCCLHVVDERGGVVRE